jgi:hypothetical protein
MRSVLRLCVWVALVCLLVHPAVAQPRLPSQNPPSDPSPGSLGPPSRTPSPGSSAQELWGAIGFTSDGSYSTAWKQPSKAEAEAKVAVACAKFGRGRCEIISFPGNICAALASYSNRRYRGAYTAGGSTTPEAQQAAVARCNQNKNARKGCQLRITVCGDGR